MNQSTARQYGLIGYPLDHSFSPGYFSEKFLREGIEATYQAFPLEDIVELPSLLVSYPHLHGLNVTTPHKEAVLPYLDHISDDAKAIGAVNCILIKDGKLSGYNTDWTGFRDSLIPLLNGRLWPALILGNGGAARAVRYALKHLGIAYTLVSRKPEGEILSYEDLTAEIISLHPLIINTTTLGTLGKGLPPIPYEGIGYDHLLYDLVYNPAQTPFLAAGEERRAATKNGLEMLERQAESSWQIWLHHP